MYINSRAYPRAYREILNSARASASTSNAGQVGVLVLVAPDVDALCACRILVGLLRHDQIGHNVVPVAGWSELARVNREMVEGNTKVRTCNTRRKGQDAALQEAQSFGGHKSLLVYDGEGADIAFSCISRRSSAQSSCSTWDLSWTFQNTLHFRNKQHSMSSTRIVHITSIISSLRIRKPKRLYYGTMVMRKKT